MEDIKVIDRNSCLVLSNAGESKLLKRYFTRSEVEWSTGKPKTVESPLYIKDGNDLIIPKGLVGIIDEDFEIDEINKSKCLSDYEVNYTNDQAKSILNGLSLRDFQIEAINKMLSRDRACAQIATGAGKTLIIAGLYKLACKKVGKELTGLIIVPSSHLFHETAERLRSYGCEVNRYNHDIREIKEGVVNVTMVQSMINDLESGNLNSDLVDIIIVDEAHHTTAETYYKLIGSFKNAIGVYGLSGSLFSKPLSYYNFKDLYSFSLLESRLVSIYSECVCNIDYSYLVKLGFLTDCKIYQIETNIGSKVINNFTRLAPETIESEERLLLLVQAIKRAMELGYKKLICFTRVKEAGERFMRYLESEGIKSLIVYGGRQNGYLEGDEIKYVGDNILLPEFESGDYSVIIGTSAINEGVDLPKCDGIVLLAGGQSVTQVLQRIGRGVRLAEGKKYAIVIDTYDKGHPITKKHSRERERIYNARLNREVKRIKKVSDLV